MTPVNVTAVAKTATGAMIFAPSFRGEFLEVDRSVGPSRQGSVGVLLTKVNDYCSMTVVPVPIAPSTSQRSRQRQETRERIFQAAVAEFRRVGVQDAQIPRIAEAAGVVRGTFYFHFSSKEEVLDALATQLQTEIMQQVQALRARGISFGQMLAGLAEAVARASDALVGENLIRDVMATFLRLHVGTDGPGAAIQEELTQQIEQAVASGELRADLEPGRVASMLLASIFGIMILPRQQDREPRAELELLASLLTDGMRRPGGPE
jgi:TetR/AcrR family transcriptional repressor of uid operon